MTLTRRQERHDTAANWTSANPTLAAGELGVETDTHKIKAGDGSTAWADLPYAAGGSGGSGSTITVEGTANATGTSGAAAAATIPDGVVAGDIIVAFVGSNYAVTPAGVPTGFMLGAYTTGSMHNIAVLAKRATGSEGGTTLSIPLDGSAGWSINIVIVRGATRIRDYLAIQYSTGTTLTSNRYMLRAGPPDLLLVAGTARDLTGTVSVTPTGTTVSTATSSGTKTVVVAADTHAPPVVNTTAGTSGLGVAAIALA